MTDAEYDIIVVGAGPSGSRVARNFSEKGEDVLVIERSEEIGKPLACSGHVSEDIWDFVPEGKKNELLQNKINEAVFHNNSKEYSFYRDETISYVIDRVKLDKILAKEARKAGAKIKTGEEVKDIIINDEIVEVRTDKRTYSSKILAGCDGAHSTVRKNTGINEPDHFYQGLMCFSDEDDSSDNVDVFMDIPKFFGWRIPRAENVEYGVGVPKGEEPVKWLEEITDNYDIEKEKHCAGPIPIGPPSKITDERVFLVGDAAAQTKPFTGGGIIYGLRCADIASETIDSDDHKTLIDYEYAWRKELITDIRIGRIIEKSYSLPDFIQNKGLSFFEGEIGVHMDKPTTLFSMKQFKALTREKIVRN